SADTVQHVRELVRIAALSGDDDWDRLMHGVLVHEPTPSLGFGVIPPGVSASVADARRTASGDRELRSARRAAEDDVHAVERASAHATRLRQEANQLSAEATAADARARAAEEEAARAQEQADRSRAALARLEG